MSDPSPRTPPVRILLAYGAMLGATVGIYLFLRERGERLVPALPSDPGAPRTAQAESDVLAP